MNMRLLVAYASKYGATREIAERIGHVLRLAGLQVDVLPVRAVGDLAPYQAVILGSAVYIGKWMKDACEFIAKHEMELAKRRVWLFSSGPTGEGDPVALLDGWRLPADQKPIIDRIQPREIVVFHGNISLAQVNFIEKTAVQALKKPFGDFRNWDTITSWVTAIAESVKETEPSFPSLSQ